MRSEYVPLRQKVEEAHKTASSYEQRLARLEQTVEELNAFVRKVLTAERRVRRGKSGEAEGVDLVDGDQVIASLNIQRNGDGRISRTK